MTTCAVTGCQTPHVPTPRYRLWVYGEHYDHRTREAAVRHMSRLSSYDQDATMVVAVLEAEQREQ